MPSQTEPSLPRAQVEGQWSAASAYRPSIFLLCVLIFWTGITAISEMIIPFTAILFTIVTYAPTLHFASQAIVRRSVQVLHPPDTLQTSRRARILTGIWILNMGIHVGLWFPMRDDAYAGIFLLPTIPSSQAILLIMFIAIRYTVGAHLTRRERNLVMPRDDEEPTSFEPTTLPRSVEPSPNYSDNISPRQECSEANQISTTATPSPIVLLYRPSLFLLLISISLSVYTIILEFQNDRSPESDGAANIAIIPTFQAYIPTILFHAYLIVQILRRQAKTLKHATTFAGLSFDIIPLWLGARMLTVYVHYPAYDGLRVPLIHVLPGSIEFLLVIYFAIRYTRSVYAERMRQIGLGIIYDREAPAASSVQSVDSDSFVEPPSFYIPSTTILIISILLSTACLIIESIAEPICGVPMSAIVYVPTILIHVHFIYQQYHNPNTTATIQSFNRLLECSMQLALIWIITQAFYVFVWPVSQYLKAKVMNPWVRWPEVALIVYIVARYLRDRHVRNSTGGVNLSPNLEEEVAAEVVPPPADDGQ